MNILIVIGMLKH